MEGQVGEESSSSPSVGCKVCSQPMEEDQEWVQCEGCEGMFHQDCLADKPLHSEWWCDLCRKSLNCLACGCSPEPWFHTQLQVSNRFLDCTVCHYRTHPECYGYLPKAVIVQDGWTCVKCKTMNAGENEEAEVDEEAGRRRSTRTPKSRLVDVDGHSVLTQNMYDLETGEPSVFESEFDAKTNRKEAEAKGSSVAAINTVGPTGANKMLRFILFSLPYFNGRAASFTQLILWSALHRWDVFGCDIIVDLVALAVRTGMNRGVLRSERVVGSAEDALSPTQLAKWKKEAGEHWQPWAEAVLKVLRPRSAAKLCVLMTEEAIRAALKKDGQSKAATKLPQLLQALIDSSAVDRMPHCCITEAHGEQSGPVVYGLRNMVRLPRGQEPLDEMKAWELSLKGGDLEGAVVPRTKTQSVEEQRRLSHNKALMEEQTASLKLQQLYLARHREWLRPFMDKKDIKLLDEVALTCNLRSAGGDHDDNHPWLNPLHAVEDTPSYIVGGDMRPHQLEGLSWLRYMHRHGTPMILGDEMGLGKTLQTIAFLAYLKFDCGLVGASLVICPLSVLNTWMGECARWCPKLRVVRLHSGDVSERERLRRTVLGDPSAWDIVVTTYDMCTGDLKTSLSSRVVWRYVVLDEGHKIKNDQSNVSKVVRGIRSQGKLLLTGTPLQNNLKELWALLNYLLPATFKNPDPFTSAYDLDSGEVNQSGLCAAHYTLRPFILRRLKSEVELSLPPRGIHEVSVPLTEAQRFWYRQLLAKDSDVLSRLEAASGSTGATNSDGAILKPTTNDWKRLQSLMMQLRKCCNHPYLFHGADPHPGDLREGLVTASGKMAMLDRLLPKMKAAGHRVCLFSQFTSMLDIIEDYCNMRRLKYRRLDGSISRVRRAISIAEYQKEGSKIFLFIMSTRAGGLGITLTAADTVILFDSDWNPQVDIQAMARVHRIGQTKRVSVMRLVTEGTIEQRMVQRAQKKLFLDQMVNRGSSKQAEETEELDFSQLLDMFRFGMQAINRSDAKDRELTEAEIDALMDRSGYTYEDPKKPTPIISSAKGEPVEQPAKGEPIAQESSAAKGEPMEVSSEKIGASAGIDLKAAFDPSKGYCSLTTFDGVDYRPAGSVKDIARLFRQAQVAEEEKRIRKSRVQVIDGHTVLNVNNYDLGQTLSVFDREQGGLSEKARDGFKGPAKRRMCIAGRDYTHSEICHNCWDGGDLVCCDGCPASYHASCLGTTMTELHRRPTFRCPHHECFDCGRNVAQAGGLLFRCIACPSAFCEDHAPVNMICVGECKRFKALGQPHPTNAYFIYCSEQCREFDRKHSKFNEEEDSDEEEPIFVPQQPYASAAGGGGSSSTVHIVTKVGGVIYDNNMQNGGASTSTYMQQPPRTIPILASNGVPLPMKMQDVAPFGSGTVPQKRKSTSVYSNGNRPAAAAGTVPAGGEAKKKKSDAVVAQPDVVVAPPIVNPANLTQS